MLRFCLQEPIKIFKFKKELHHEYSRKKECYNCKKKNVTIVFSGTANLAFAIANVMIGIEKYSPSFVNDYFIFHDKIVEYLNLN